MNGKKNADTPSATKMFFAAALLLCAAALVMPASASTLIGGTLTVSGIDYTPSPAEPGRYIDVFISLDNGAYAINNVECRIDAAFPFSIDDPAQGTKSIAYLPVGQGTVMKYQVRVAANAVTGNNDLLFSCRSQSVDWTQAKMSVYVKVQEAVVSIPEVKLSPQELAPGGQATLSITLQNNGNSPVKDISLSPVFSDDVPFTTVGGSNSKNLAILEPQSSQNVSFEILAFPNAAVKAYRLPLAITYYDDAGAKQERTDYVGIIVASKPELSVTLESSTLNRNDSTGTIIIQIINKGIADAKFLEADVSETPGVKILSGQKNYVGALDSDDYQTIEVKAYAAIQANQGSRMVLPVMLSFKDANDRSYTQTAEIAVPLYSQNELEKYGFAAPQGIIMTVLLVVVVLAAAYFGYTRFLKKKNEKK